MWHGNIAQHHKVLFVVMTTVSEIKQYNPTRKSLSYSVVFNHSICTNLLFAYQ